MSAYDRGDAVAALSELDRLAECRGTESDIVSLDRAIIYLLASQPNSAIHELELTRRRLDYHAQIDVGEQTISALNDDSSVAWSGRNFERRMIDNLQILASLLQSDGESFALSSRGMAGVHADARDAGLSLEFAGLDTAEAGSGSAPAPFRYSANRMTAWLAATVRSERIHDAEVTDRMIQQVVVWQPSGAARIDDLQTLGTGAPQNHGTLQVLTLAGRISPWRSEPTIPTTAALLVADRILSATGDHSLPATTSPVLIARPVQRRYAPKFLTHVFVAGQPAKPSRILVDLNATAWDSWRVESDRQLARAVVRRVVKKGTIYGAKNALNVPKGSGTDMLLNVAGMFWESREQADLRQWNLLPAAVEVAQMKLPAGSHRVQLRVYAASRDAAGSPSDQLEIPVNIQNGQNTFVVCFRPYNRLVGVQSSITSE
jgi:hypothetical protein